MRVFLLLTVCLVIGGVAGWFARGFDNRVRAPKPDYAHHAVRRPIIMVTDSGVVTKSDRSLASQLLRDSDPAVRMYAIPLARAIAKRIPSEAAWSQDIIDRALLNNPMGNLEPKLLEPSSERSAGQLP